MINDGISHAQLCSFLSQGHVRWPTMKNGIITDENEKSGSAINKQSDAKQPTISLCSSLTNSHVVIGMF